MSWFKRSQIANQSQAYLMQTQMDFAQEREYIEEKVKQTQQDIQRAEGQLAHMQQYINILQGQVNTPIPTNDPATQMQMTQMKANAQKELALSQSQYQYLDNLVKNRQDTLTKLNDEIRLIDSLKNYNEQRTMVNPNSNQVYDNRMQNMFNSDFWSNPFAAYMTRS